MLIARCAFLAAAGALAAGAPAGAATPAPAVTLAKVIKKAMQKSYDQHKVAFTFTTVTCKIASTGTTAACQAHFTDKAAQLVGVIQVAVTIKPKTGEVDYQPTSIACNDSKTGAKLKSC